jgi:hypothetical protein
MSNGIGSDFNFSSEEYRTKLIDPFDFNNNATLLCLDGGVKFLEAQ